MNCTIDFVCALSPNHSGPHVYILHVFLTTDILAFCEWIHVTLKNIDNTHVKHNVTQNMIIKRHKQAESAVDIESLTVITIYKKNYNYKMYKYHSSVPY